MEVMLKFHHKEIFLITCWVIHALPFKPVVEIELLSFWEFHKDDNHLESISWCGVIVNFCGFG
jgi:hypothetical protein